MLYGNLIFSPFRSNFVLEEIARTGAVVIPREVEVVVYGGDREQLKRNVQCNSSHLFTDT